MGRSRFVGDLSRSFKRSGNTISSRKVGVARAVLRGGGGAGGEGERCAAGPRGGAGGGFSKRPCASARGRRRVRSGAAAECDASAPPAMATLGLSKVFILDKYFTELQKFWETEKKLQGERAPPAPSLRYFLFVSCSEPASSRVWMWCRCRGGGSQEAVFVLASRRASVITQ